MIYFKRLNLQLFADGAASGAASGGEGAETGENAVDAGQRRLLELGVPEDKLRKRAKKGNAKPEAAVQHTPRPQAASAEEPQATEEKENGNPADGDKQEPAAKPSFDDLMKDPDYNSQMQAIIKARIRDFGQARDALSKITPALELLARKYKLDPSNIDYAALNDAISGEKEYYEDKAIEMGVSVEAARKLDQDQRDNARQQKELAQQKMDQMFANHILSLERQGEKLRETFPGFDLRQELQNPVFARMTSPGGGISVEDAYYAVHRKELQTAAMQAAVEKTAQKISNSIQSGQRRPTENGAASQAPSVTQFDWHSASRQQREEMRQRIRTAAARGEKIYPGR